MGNNENTRGNVLPILLAVALLLCLTGLGAVTYFYFSAKGELAAKESANQQLKADLDKLSTAFSDSLLARVSVHQDGLRDSLQTYKADLATEATALKIARNRVAELERRGQPTPKCPNATLDFTSKNNSELVSILKKSVDALKNASRQKGRQLTQKEIEKILAFIGELTDILPAQDAISKQNSLKMKAGSEPILKRT